MLAKWILHKVHTICVVLECNDFGVIMKYVDANNQEMEGLRHEWYLTFCKWMNKTQITDINNKWQQTFSFKFKTEQSSRLIQIKLKCIITAAMETNIA